MSVLCVSPGKPLRGETRVPGDKSISHRAALFTALAEGESRIEGFLVSGVTRAMTDALTSLGVEWSLHGTTLQVTGRGLRGWKAPEQTIDCGNSGTTLRLLAGALAAAGTPAVLDGSDGLRRRPMDRIVVPLRRMGAPIRAADGGRAPLRLEARPQAAPLRGGEVALEVASAQVKTCLLLAGLAADGTVSVLEPAQSRDHTERMLAAMGARIEAGRVDGPEKGASGLWWVSLYPMESPLRPLDVRVPGDFSAAAFLIVAALITPGSQICVRDVGLNPTRTGLLYTLWEMGAKIQIENERLQAGESIGDLRIEHSELRGGRVSGERVVQMIDEFPVFGVAAAFARGDTQVSQAQELRHKESDRISALCMELQSLGADVAEETDGFNIHGRGGLAGGASVQSHGDHRLAMSLALAGLASDGPVEVEGAEMMSESYPEFSDVLCALGADVHWKDA